MTIIRCVDFETTGLEPSDAIVEIGRCDVWITDEETTIDPPQSELIDPRVPIPPEAMATHHISDGMVARKRNADQALPELFNDVGYFCAHVADFEQKFYVAPVPFICTYKSALRVWPDAPSHSLQVLRYWLGLDCTEELAMPPHRAGPDAYVCAHLLVRLLSEVDIEHLVRWSSGPALLIKCHFKKHRGKKWSEIAETDPGYLEWIVREINDDPDTRATAKYWLKKMVEKSAF